MPAGAHDRQHFCVAFRKASAPANDVSGILLTDPRNAADRLRIQL